MSPGWVERLADSLTVVYLCARRGCRRQKKLTTDCSTQALVPACGVGDPRFPRVGGSVVPIIVSAVSRGAESVGGHNFGSEQFQLRVPICRLSVHLLAPASGNGIVAFDSLIGPIGATDHIDLDIA